MNYKIFASKIFEKRLKKLSKHYKSMKDDYAEFLKSLNDNPNQGVDLGNGLRKIRMSIKSKNKGKSGGARVITFNVIIDENNGLIELLTIYDKSEYENISENELKQLIKHYSSILD